MHSVPYITLYYSIIIQSILKETKRFKNSVTAIVVILLEIYLYKFDLLSSLVSVQNTTYTVKEKNKNRTILRKLYW